MQACETDISDSAGTNPGNLLPRMSMSWYSSRTYGVKLRECSRVCFCGGGNKVPCRAARVW
jgi:hypothetical protein